MEKTLEPENYRFMTVLPVTADSSEHFAVLCLSFLICTIKEQSRSGLAWGGECGAG
jgi:hypothetical protein